MLDLNKLEEKLNQALEKETNESLTNWLKNKRKVNSDFFLGEGELYEMEIECFSTTSNVVTEIEFKFESQSLNSFNYDFAKAA